MSQEGNPLATGPGPEASGPGISPSDHAGMMDHLGGQMAMANTQLDKLDKAHALLGATRAEMDTLAGMGDMVSQEDVIRGASKLVAAGLSAGAVAGMLADMPADGKALAGWVAQQDQQVKQREAQLAPARALAAHQVASAGLRTLIGHAVAPPAGETAPTTDSAFDSENALAPAGGSLAN